MEVNRAIREHDPDNIIVVGSPHWCQDVHSVADDSIKEYENLMYTLHFYARSHKEELEHGHTMPYPRTFPFLFLNALPWTIPEMVL